MTSDTIEIQEGIGEKFGEGIKFVSQFFAGFIIGFVHEWRVALVMCATFPLLALSIGWILHHVRKAAIQSQKNYAIAGSVANEVLSSIRTVAAFGLEPNSLERYTKHVALARSAQMEHGHKIAIGIGGTMASIFFTYGLGLWYGGTLVAGDTNVNVGDVLTVFYSILIGSFALGQAAPQLVALGNAKSAARGTVELVERNSLIDSFSDLGAQPPELFDGDIYFDHINFSYPNRDDTPVLVGLSLYVLKGTTVAFVGESGCGKSTICSLLQRFYDPIDGNITINGTQIKDVNIQYLRENIGVVSQEPVLFAGTILENIQYGRSSVKATFEQIIEAAKVANAHDFIQEFPDGYQTLVGERGIQLSGGQKQRIAIARAILKDPPILILDEATSALDTESEQQVQAALDNLVNKKNRITIIIAHRLTTIAKADRIAVIQQGRVVEQGSHDEILSKYPSGEYSRLIKHQLKPSDSTINASGKNDEGARIVRQHSNSSKKSLMDAEIDNNTAINHKSAMRRLWNSYSCRKSFVIVSFVCATIGGLAFPLIAILLTEYVSAMQDLTGDELRSKILTYMIIMMILGVVMLVVRYGQTYTINWLSEKLVEDLRVSVFQSIVAQDIAWFDREENRTGALLERLSSDPPKVKALTGENLGKMIQASSTLFFALFVAFLFGSWQLSLVLMLVLPILILCFIVNAKKMRGNTIMVQQSLEESSKVANACIDSVHTVMQFNLGRTMLQKYEDTLQVPSQQAIRNGKVGGIVAGLTQFVSLGAYGIIFYVGSKLVDSNTITFSQLFRSLMVIMMAAQSIGTSSSFAGDHTEAKKAAHRMYTVVDQTSRLKQEEHSSTEDLPESCEVQFDQVSFFYESRPNSIVLEQFSLTIPAGKTTALVGASGSGKSSIIALLERFYDPTSTASNQSGGIIFINGKNIANMNITSLRRLIGYVGQEPVLFSTSIRENISNGFSTASDTDIENVAKLANAHHFIVKFPLGYDTIVGPRATQLSGGQKQRIAIARAILRNPKLLLLDEATSALDTEGESVVQTAIDKLLQSTQATAIVVAHRLSTIRNADTIVVLDHGHVVETGSHTQLMTKPHGHYRKLLEASKTT